MKRAIAMTLLLTALSATPALACPVCFGASDSLQFKGAQMGILALLAVTVGMLGAFATFFVYLRRRIRMVETDQAPPRFSKAPTEELPDERVPAVSG